jgi:fumarate reductase subunit D
MTPNDQQDRIQQVGGGGDQVREQDKIMLVLAYLGILSLIPLLTVKDSDYVKWHAKQGLVLGIAWFVISIPLAFIPFAPCLAFVGGIVLVVMGIKSALEGKRWRMPLLADLADKF